MSDPVARTRCWVKEVVIGLNLCPFARGPFEADTIRYWVCSAQDADGAYRALIEEVADFIQQSPDEVETGLFIIPRGWRILVTTWMYWKTPRPPWRKPAWTTCCNWPAFIPITVSRVRKTMILPTTPTVRPIPCST